MYGRVCVVKATGKLIEFQSGEEPIGTLIQNAINVGYNKDDIEERYVDKSEWETISSQWVNPPITIDPDKDTSKEELLAEADKIMTDLTNVIDKQTFTSEEIIQAVKDQASVMKKMVDYLNHNA